MRPTRGSAPGPALPQRGAFGRHVEPGNADAGAIAIPRRGFSSRVYAALDLGTNNCRLLIARPAAGGFRVVDAFSRIVRLGEGVCSNGRLGEAAADRAIEALRICADKIAARGVIRGRYIATEACRLAEDGPDFVARVKEETGLELDIVDRATEARLAACGCFPLVDPQADGVVLFDIGGGSTELVWVDRVRRHAPMGSPRIRSWVSLPAGVVTLAERYGGIQVTPDVFKAMVEEVTLLIASFPERLTLAEAASRLHLLGTSGTVTTIAGIHLGLERYERGKVDGIWLDDPAITDVVSDLQRMSYEERIASPCIGKERADLVLAGCAILEAIRRAFPCARLRVADRGLREGILLELMRADGAWRLIRGTDAA
ncbi:Ppx/GppA phosphatase family protein [Agaricicola taiwanensis]|uniref:Ppx/GppA phosphatase family protein n=1 Tax=Agaricicola taiwanensis TaxID=591372 RepID=UPI001E33D77B|nr:Ppx/GppA phosphatase family protein [Agaricicola taiwanensis]